jgi:hypothetical protein
VAGAAVAVVNIIVEMTMEHCVSPFVYKTYHDVSRYVFKKIYLYLRCARGREKKTAEVFGRERECAGHDSKASGAAATANAMSAFLEVSKGRFREH